LFERSASMETDSVSRRSIMLFHRGARAACSFERD
jgi:hypothetical protein